VNRECGSKMGTYSRYDVTTQSTKHAPHFEL